MIFIVGIATAKENERLHEFRKIELKMILEMVNVVYEMVMVEYCELESFFFFENHMVEN